MEAPVFLAEVMRCFTGLLLLAAVIGKLRVWHTFRANLSDSLGLGAAWSRVLAPAVVVAEGAIAALVLYNGAVAYAAMAGALLMMASFTGFMAYKFVREDLVRCSCFGEAGRAFSGFDLLRNGLVIAAIAYYLATAPVGMMETPVAGLALALGAILAIVAVAFHDVVTLLLFPEEGVA